MAAELTEQQDNRIQDQRLHRMSSITRKLHFQMFRKKIAIYIIFDLVMAFVLTFGWAFELEMREIGNFDLSHSREIVSEGNSFWNLFYVVSEGNVELYRTKCSIALLILIVVMGSLIVVELLAILAAWHGETKKIRRTLQPINEIALRADAMSRLSFSDAIYNTESSPEESFRRLENAITKLNPDQEAMPALGDRDLQGIESAMNNLLRRMHESYQQQARFVNDASHELRTPIAVIQGYAKMLDRWGREDESVLNESITAISHEADHMKQLVEQLLFLARGDAGRTQLKQEPIYLTAMMQEIYEESLMIDEKHPYRFRLPKDESAKKTPAPEAAEKAEDGVLEGTVEDAAETEDTIPAAPEGPVVIGDPMLLKQMVRILVDNAAKYTKEGDDISLSVGYDGNGDPYLQVQDSGIGMAEADVEHMFERFYRSDEAREIKGTGLGLAIAKWIVDRHGGHFEILSRTELGTRIRVLLPQEK